LKPNIVIVLCDDTRPDHMGCYGYGRNTTPGIDRIAREGTLYENCISPAVWTLPSVACLFTGTYNSLNGVFRGHPYLDSRFETLAEILGREGYRTLAVSNIAWISRGTRFDRGFQRFHQNWQLVQSRSDVAWDRRIGRVRARNMLAGPVSLLNGVWGRYFWKRRDYGALRTTEVVERWIREAAGDTRPFFLFVHYLEPHLLFNPPEPYRSRFFRDSGEVGRAMEVNQDALAYAEGRVQMTENDFALLRNLYDGEIAYTDHHVGRIASLLEDLGVGDTTALFITSDHGQNLGDHGLMSHRYCLYDTLLKVPLIARLPGVFDAGQRVSEQVQSVDIYPAIMNMLGLEITPHLQGTSLLPAALKSKSRDFAFAEYLASPSSMASTGLLEGKGMIADGVRLDRKMRAVRARDFKLIKKYDPGEEDELYNVMEDPGETENLCGTMPDEAARLGAVLDEWLSSFKQRGFEGEDRVDPELKKQLEGLGYL